MPTVYLLIIYMYVVSIIFACIRQLQKCALANCGYILVLNMDWLNVPVILLIMHLTTGCVHLNRVLGSYHWGQHSKAFVRIILMRMGSLPHLLQPPSKRLRMSMNDNTAQLTQEKYEDAVTELKQAYRGDKKKRNYEMMELMQPQRCEWILEKRPLVAEIAEKFPFLSSSKTVSSSNSHSMLSHRMSCWYWFLI